MIGCRNIPLAVPNVGEREVELVVTAIRDGWISSVGPQVDAFEEAVRAVVGATGAVAVTSGTAALHLSLRLAGLQPGEMVILPTLTFIAPANAVRHHGAWPVFLDVDPATWQLSPEAVAAFLQTRCERTPEGVVHNESGLKVTGIVPVHLLGHPAPMHELQELADGWGLWVVEDAAEAMGTLYEDGCAVGGRGRLVCFSFNGNKIVSTGGGGMIVSDDAELCRNARFLSTQAKADPAEYIHTEIGYNYRLTNVQAALGVAQMERLPDFIRRKIATADRYRAELGALGVRFMRPREGAGCTWWLCTGVLPEGVDRRRVQAEMKKRGIEVRPLWQPLHRSPAMTGSWTESSPVAEELYDRCISVPSSTGITEGEIDEVVAALAALIAGD